MRIESCDNAAQSNLASSEDLSKSLIDELLIAMGSNDNAAYYLPLAQAKLEQLGSIVLTDALVNPDFTATAQHPKPDYTNQCVYLKLQKPLDLAALIQQFRQIENDCDRARSLDATTNSLSHVVSRRDKQQCASDAQISEKIKKVSVDIDILALKVVGEPSWQISKRRLPFKTHEVIGLTQLLRELQAVDFTALIPYLRANHIHS